jgi:hypothetical protein
MKQQTAIEWLIEHLQKSKDWQRVLNEVSQISTIEFNLIQQAKEMEKEQIIEAYDDGWLYNNQGKYNPEQYYNQTFQK